MKIYIYNEIDATLNDILDIKKWDDIKSILYNLSDKNNELMITLKDCTASKYTKRQIKEYSDNLKFHCQHIYKNNGNFLKSYGV